MKRYYILPVLLALLLAGCKQEDVERYDPDLAMISFRNASSVFSFKTNRGDIASIPFDVVGYPVDAERTARFAVVEDSTTAAAGLYEIVDAIVPAGSFSGTLRVRVGWDNNIRDSLGRRVYLRTATGDDFEAGPVNYQYHSLNLTNLLAKPTEWNSNAFVNGYLGVYSTAYYAFIIEATGVERFPFMGALTIDGVVHPRWTAAQMTLFMMNLADQLRQRNQREGTPLLHDDGPAAGYEVVVGKAVYP